MICGLDGAASDWWTRTGARAPNEVRRCGSAVLTVSRPGGRRAPRVPLNDGDLGRSRRLSRQSSMLAASNIVQAFSRAGSLTAGAPLALALAMTRGAVSATRYDPSAP